jgi:hypothetical protein
VICDDTTACTVLTTQGTLGCGAMAARTQYNDKPPRYNYAFAPCQDEHAAGPFCIPPGDVYATAVGCRLPLAIPGPEPGLSGI